MRPNPTPPEPGQESVWDYPRPPRLELCHRSFLVRFAGRTVVACDSCWRVLETSHPPVYYFPVTAIDTSLMRPATGSSYCEWKGMARYWDIVAEGREAPRAAWSYPDPEPPFETIRDQVAFYAGMMDECYVDSDLVTPQPGGFYGGWITPDVIGPFKGGPGSGGW